MPKTALDWRKSSRSSQGSECVEVGFAPEVVGVRDSKNVSGPVLEFSSGRWAAFLGQVKRGVS